MESPHLCVLGRSRFSSTVNKNYYLIISGFRYFLKLCWVSCTTGLGSICSCKQSTSSLTTRTSFYWFHDFFTKIIDSVTSFVIIFIRITIHHRPPIFTVRLHVMQRTVLLSQFCPSVRLSVRPSVCPSDACIVTKLNNALRIFWYHTKRQSL